jgi:hypothetical protein
MANSDTKRQPWHAEQARFLHGPEMQEKPNLSTLEEFLLHGVKYAFPAEH